MIRASEGGGGGIAFPPHCLFPPCLIEGRSTHTPTLTSPHICIPPLQTSTPSSSPPNPPTDPPSPSLLVRLPPQQPPQPPTRLRPAPRARDTPVRRHDTRSLHRALLLPRERGPLPRGRHARRAAGSHEVAAAAVAADEAARVSGTRVSVHGCAGTGVVRAAELLLWVRGGGGVEG